MTSEVDIANLALGRIKQGSITEFDEDTTEAAEAARLYPIARAHVLGDFPWRVNSVIETLAETTNDREDDWSFRYLRPTCLRFYGVLDEAGRINQRRRVRYEINSAGIYTDVQYARCAIGTLVTDTTLYSPALVSCIAWRLACELVPVLDADINLMAWARREYTSEKDECWATDAAEFLLVDDGVTDGLPESIACRE